MNLVERMGPHTGPSSIPAQLERLRRLHHALFPVYQLYLPFPTVLATQLTQEWLIDHILFDPAIKDRIPENGYEKRFWRKVVGVLEDGVKELQAAGEDVRSVF